MITESDFTFEEAVRDIMDSNNLVCLMGDGLAINVAHIVCIKDITNEQEVEDDKPKEVSVRLGTGGKICS